MVIKHINGNNITIEPALTYLHYGSVLILQAEYGSIDMRANILYLKRNIKMYGCRAQPFTYNDGEKDVEGSIHLENVEMDNCGTINTLDRACVNLLLINNNTMPSKIIGCAIHDGLGVGLYVKTS